MKKMSLLIPSLLACQLSYAEEPAEREPASEEWKFTMGGGMAFVPRYEGASSRRVRFVPVFEAKRGRFFAGVSRGVGYDFSGDPHLRYGPRVGITPYRRQNADVRLNGMGDISYGAEAGGFFEAHYAPWYANTELGAGPRGVRLELGGGIEAKLGGSDRVRGGVEVNWANGRYMQTYFGVTQAQAAASGGVLTPYTASSGIRHYGVSFNWIHDFGRGWFSNAGLNFRQISGSLATSWMRCARSAAHSTARCR